MKTVSLHGLWQIQAVDKSFKLEGQVPTSVFYELEKAGHWGEHDVFYRENNRKCVEIAARDVVFDKTFDLDADFLKTAQAKFVLEADGLDTIAVVTLNGQFVAQTENMHRRWRWDVGSLLKEGRNTLSILFKNTIEEITKRDQQRQLWQVGTPVKGANHLRKMYCSFGWDWGPQIPDIGIYRDIRLVAYEGARLSDVHVTQKHEAGRVTVNVASRLETWAEGNDSVRVRILDPQGKVLSEKDYRPEENKSFIVEKPELWWPNGYGAQPLYTVETELLRSGKSIDKKTQRIGLRTLRLEQEKDQWGKSFQFNVNGIAIFGKGANYIPEDVYLNRVTPTSTRKLMQTCKDANFNLLRVWGGGIYPNDSFFDICDELGIIIWQDLMFSCSIYDIHNPVFFENITHEVRDALHRMRHHASLGLICGNNEMEWAFEEWDFPKTKENRVEYIKQYEVLFPALVAEVCPEIDYWPASPSSGGNFDKPNDYSMGDVHDWGVWHGRKSYTEFRKHHYRFLSEFGFQSFPNYKTVKAYTAPEDRNIFSAVMEDHQRNESDNGNSKIFHFIADYYRYPKDFPSILYVSQLSQAEAVRYAVEHLRQNRGRCMGTTYWQLNDNWPTASWSSVDYYGRWKAMHYSVKRCYDPVLMSIKESKTGAELHVTNDRLEPTFGEITWSLLTLKGKILKQGKTTLEVTGLASAKILDLDFTAELQGHDARERYLSVAYTDKKDGVTRYATATFVPYKYLQLENPELSFKIEESPESWKSQVKAGASFAKFVGLDLEHDDVVFSDNFFDLDAGQTRTIDVPRQAISKEALQKQLTLRSVFDTY